jgi:hypothetical protein
VSVATDLYVHKLDIRVKGGEHFWVVTGIRSVDLRVGPEVGRHISNPKFYICICSIPWVFQMFADVTDFLTSVS